MSMCNETSMNQTLEFLQQWVNIGVILAAAGMPRSSKEIGFFGGIRSNYKSTSFQQVSKHTFMNFVNVLKKGKLKSLPWFFG